MKAAIRTVIWKFNDSLACSEANGMVSFLICQITSGAITFASGMNSPISADRPAHSVPALSSQICPVPVAAAPSGAVPPAVTRCTVTGHSIVVSKR